MTSSSAAAGARVLLNHVLDILGMAGLSAMEVMRGDDVEEYGFPLCCWDEPRPSCPPDWKGFSLAREPCLSPFLPFFFCLFEAQTPMCVTLDLDLRIKRFADCEVIKIWNFKFSKSKNPKL